MHTWTDIKKQIKNHESSQLIAQNPGKRIPEISTALNIPGKTLERWIRSAYKKALIEFRGSKRTGGYFLMDETYRKA